MKSSRPAPKRPDPAPKTASPSDPQPSDPQTVAAPPVAAPPVAAPPVAAPPVAAPPVAAPPVATLSVKEIWQWLVSQTVTVGLMMGFGGFTAVVSAIATGYVMISNFDKRLDSVFDAKLYGPLKDYDSKIANSVRDMDARIGQSLKLVESRSKEKENELEDIKNCVLASADMTARLCSKDYDGVITSYNDLTIHYVKEDRIPEAIRLSIYQSLVAAYVNGEKFHLLTASNLQKMDEAITKNARNKCLAPGFLPLGYCYLGHNNPQKARTTFISYLLEAGSQPPNPETAYAYVGLMLTSLVDPQKATKEERIQSALFLMEESQAISPIAYSTVIENIRSSDDKGIFKHLRLQHQATFVDALNGLVKKLDGDRKVRKVRYGESIYLIGEVSPNGKRTAIRQHIGFRNKEEVIEEGKGRPPMESEPLPKESGCCFPGDISAYIKRHADTPPPEHELRRSVN